MSRKKRRPARPWWRGRGVTRRLALAGSLVAAVTLVVWAWISFGGGEAGTTSQELATQAPAFTLPTVAGDEFSLADHVGQPARPLYFNEGVG